MPSSTLDDLLDRYAYVSASNKTLLDGFARVAQLFQQNHIPFVLLKGADVLSRLYGVRGIRPLSDVDLLVREEDVPAIDRLLLPSGFVSQIDGNPAYFSPTLRLSLDLVTRLWYLDDQQLAELWARTRRRPFSGLTVSCLATDDLLIHLTAYAVIHRAQLSSAFSQDLRLLIKKESPDWSIVLERSQLYGLRVPLFVALTHVSRLFPALTIPEGVLAKLAPVNNADRFRAWLLRTLVTTEPLPELGHLLLFLTRPKGRKIEWLKQRLWPSFQFLSWRYGNTGGLTPTRTRLVRLYRLAVAALRLSVRLLQRLTTATTGRAS